MVSMNKTMPTWIAHGLSHTAPDGIEWLAGRIAETHGSEVARTDFAGRINEEVLRAGSTAEKFRTFNLIESTDFGLQSFAIDLDMELPNGGDMLGFQ